MVELTKNETFILKCLKEGNVDYANLSHDMENERAMDTLLNHDLIEFDDDVEFFVPTEKGNKVLQS